MIRPNIATAAAAGLFSAIVWPWATDRFAAGGSAISMEYIVATLLLVALPAHAFVLGFQGMGPGADRSGLAPRVVAWLAAAIGALALVSWLQPAAG